MEGKEKTLFYLSEVTQLCIPYFQRGYVWKEEQWQKLLDEWEEGEDKDHFLGSIVINHPIRTSLDPLYGVLEIIDGQQRLTTLCILYKVIYDLLIEYNKNDELKIGKLMNQKELILGEDKIKIIHSRLDKEAFEDVICRNVDVSDITLDSDIEWYKNGKPKPNQKPLSHPIKQCYKYFRNRILDKMKDDSSYCSKFWKDLNSNRKNLFIVIAIKEEENAQQIFDCINSAGVRLSIYDTIKNYLFGKLKDKVSDNELLEMYKTYWEDIFEKDDDTKKFWNHTISIGRYKRDNAEMLLYCFAVINDIFNRDNYVISDLDSLFKHRIDELNRDELISILKSISNYAKVYRNQLIIDDEYEYKFSDKIGLLILILKILGATTFYPYVLKLLMSEENEEKKNDDAYYLIKLILRVAIANDDTSAKNYNRECYNLVNSKSEEYKKIEDYYNKRKSYEILNDISIKQNLRAVGNNVAKAVLFFIELYRRSNVSGLDRQTLQYVYTLEHIMPQKYTKNWGIDKIPVKSMEGDGTWEISKDSEEVRNSLRLSAIYEIGNMLLLTSPLNSTNSCKSMNQKIGLISELTTNLILSREFVNKYNENNIWDEEIIRNRTNELTEVLLPLI